VKRPTLGDILVSNLPQRVGLCGADVQGVAGYVNSATQRLMFAKEGGDEGWAGAWSEIAFELSQTSPYFTAPRDVARIEALDICTHPVPVQNRFYEYLRFGWGRFPKTPCVTDRCAPLQAFDRGQVPLFSDLIPPGKKLRVYLTDTADNGKRVLIQGNDANGVPISSLDGLIRVDGEFLTLMPPFVDSQEISLVTGIQKDTTIGRVTFYELDIATGDQRLVLTMEPGETVAAYRRYFVNPLPRSCCNPPSAGNTVQLTALVKLEYIPVSVPTDYLIIPNIEALTHEAQSVRYDSIDVPDAKKEAAYHHTQAIRLLQGQLVHEQGKLTPAINFAPFGSWRMRDARVGLLQ
jgi:hypothetical protein